MSILRADPIEWTRIVFLYVPVAFGLLILGGWALWRWSRS